MSQLFVLTFFRNGKEHFSTEMRAFEHPKESARTYVASEERENVPAAVLIIQLMQGGDDGMTLELEKISEVIGPLGKKDPATLAAVQREREKTIARHAKKKREPRRPKKRGGPTVFMTQAGGGIKKKTSKGTSRTLRGDEAIRAVEDVFFTGPVIEFGTGKNKRLVPLEDVQRMAAQLESASRPGGPRRKPPRRRPVKAHPTVGGVLDAVRARKPIRPCRPKFTTGVIEVSPYVQAIASQTEVRQAMSRFEACDWGDVNARTVARNNAVTRKRNGHLRGQYQSRRGVFVILSQLHPSGNAATFIALPEEVD